MKEGGWGALLALGLGSLGIGLGIVAVVLLVFSRKAAHAIGLATLALAFLAPMFGVLGMRTGPEAVDGSRPAPHPGSLFS